MWSACMTYLLAGQTSSLSPYLRAEIREPFSSHVSTLVDFRRLQKDIWGTAREENNVYSFSNNQLKPHSMGLLEFSHTGHLQTPKPSPSPANPPLHPHHLSALLPSKPITQPHPIPTFPPLLAPRLTALTNQPLYLPRLRSLPVLTLMISPMLTRSIPLLLLLLAERDILGEMHAFFPRLIGPAGLVVCFYGAIGSSCNRGGGDTGSC